MISKFFFLLIRNPCRLFASVVVRFNWLLPDKVYLSLLYRCKLGKWICWRNPKTFSEKIQWLKVYAFKAEYSCYIDKYAVKAIVAKKIGQKYIIPSIGVWENVKDIDWDSLPDQYVLKVTDEGGSNGVYICNDPDKFDRVAVAKSLSEIMNKAKKKKDVHREHPYEGVPRKIIAEKYIEGKSPSESSDLTDYKFYCFNGVPHFCQIIRNRRTKETIDFYDMEWNHMPFVGLNPTAKNGLNPVAKPQNLNVMIDICRKLSESFPFIRVDLYNVDGTVYFGELTFYPASGFGVFEPDEWNYKLGDLLKLPLEALK